MSGISVVIHSPWCDRVWFLFFFDPPGNIPFSQMQILVPILFIWWLGPHWVDPKCNHISIHLVRLSEFHPSKDIDYRSWPASLRRPLCALDSVDAKHHQHEGEVFSHVTSEWQDNIWQAVPNKRTVVPRANRIEFWIKRGSIMLYR